MEVELFNAIGSWGRWQELTFAVLFYTNIISLCHNFAMTFLTPNVPFRCVNPNDTSAVTPWPGQCSVSLPNTTESVPCEQWEYDTEQYSDTLIQKWDLVCDREWLISFSKSIFMVGFMVSVFIFGQVADRIGRYTTIIICYIIACTSMILSLFAPSMTAFLVFRFLIAFGRASFTITLYVLLMETVGTGKRTQILLLSQLGWSFGMVILVFIGYFFRDWFSLQVVIMLPYLVASIPLYFLNESPRWLIMQGKPDRFQKVVRTMARRNGKCVDDDLLKTLLNLRSEEGRKGTILDLFRKRIIRIRILITMYLWIASGFVYYALAFNTNDMFGNPYLNFLITGVVEFPAWGLLFITVPRFGRRKVLVINMCLAGAACLALIFVPSDIPWLKTALSHFGKFCVSAAFRLMYIYTGEMFPTVVRAAALGSCSMAARIGSAVAPFSKELGKASHASVPSILFSVLALSSGLFALWLPETKGRRLPDSLDEGERLEMDNRRL